MKKLMVSLVMLGGLFGSVAPALAQYVVIQPRPCYYQLVAVTTWVVVYGPYGPVYQPVVSYQYRLVCY